MTKTFDRNNSVLGAADPSNPWKGLNIRDDDHQMHWKKSWEDGAKGIAIGRFEVLTAPGHDNHGYLQLDLQEIPKGGRAKRVMMGLDPAQSRALYELLRDAFETEAESLARTLREVVTA